MERLDELRWLRGAGENRAAMDLAQELLREPKRLMISERFEVARLGAGAAMSAGEVFLAREFALAELDAANAAADSVLIGTARFHLGTVEMWLGNTAESLDQFAGYRLCDTPEVPELSKYRGAAWFNTGTVRLQRREYEEAVHCLARAREIHEAQCATHQLIETHLQEAWALLMWGRPEPSGLRLAQAVALLAEHPSPSLQATYRCHQALYHLRLGEHEAARALCESVLQPGQEGVTAHHRSEAAWIAGECALALGLLEVAWKLSQVATAEAVMAKWPYLMSRANELRRCVHEAGYQPPETA